MQTFLIWRIVLLCFRTTLQTRNVTNIQLGLLNLLNSSVGMPDYQNQGERACACKHLKLPSIRQDSIFAMLTKAGGCV